MGMGMGMGNDRQTNTLDMDKHNKMTNLESADEELSIEDAFQLMKMMGPEDPFNVRRRILESNDEYDLHKPFEYGDMLGYSLFSAMQMDENIMQQGEQQEEEGNEYDAYGDFIYYFDEYIFDFNNDNNWYEINGKLSKCSLVIPTLDHKLCIDHDTHDNDFNIRFSSTTINNNEYEYDKERRQLSKEQEEDEEEGVPYGYDQSEYDDRDNGYDDDQHPMEGFMDNIADDRRKELKELQELKQYTKEKEETELKRLKELDKQPKYKIPPNPSVYTRRRRRLLIKQYNNQLQNELSQLLLSFKSNKYWDEITHINSLQKQKQKQKRKCKSLQLFSICGERTNNNNIQINIKLGRYKSHKSSAYIDMINKYNELNNNNKATEIFDYDLNINNINNINTLQDMHWIISNDILDVDDNEWNNALKFIPKHFVTYKGYKIIRKCRNNLCICQFINFNDNTKQNRPQKHPCKPAIKADNTEIFGPNDLLHLINVMDSFLAPVHIISNNKVNNKVNNINIPWYKYKQYINLMPKHKPLWLPLWIWKELKQHMSRENNKFKANKNYRNYYTHRQYRQLLSTSNNNNWPSLSFIKNGYNKYKQIANKVTSHPQFKHFTQSGAGKSILQGAMNIARGGNIKRNLNNMKQQTAQYVNQQIPQQYKTQILNIPQRGRRRLKRSRRSSKYRPQQNAMISDTNILSDNNINEQEEEQVLDEWYDSNNNMKWIILNGNNNFDYLDFNDNNIWDEIITNIKTLKGRPLQKKCLNIFGKQLCICEFIDWLNGKIIGGNTKHICYPKEYKSTAITKKIIRKIEKNQFKKLLKKQKIKNKIKKIKNKKRLKKEKSHLKKKIKQTVKEIKKVKLKNKKIAYKKLKLGKLALSQVRNGHKGIMKKHKILLKQMKQLNKLMKTVSKQKIKNLPNERPIWLPHYFWHWLHHFPHFHQLHLDKKVPWISSAANNINDNTYNELINAANTYVNAYNEYNNVINQYDNIYDEIHQLYNDYDNDNDNYIDNDNEIDNDNHNDNDNANYNDNYIDNEIDNEIDNDDDNDNDNDNDNDTDNDNEGKQQSNTNPYWIFELIFLFACSIGIIIMIICVQTKDEQGLNTRKYGFNRINVRFDTEDTDSDCSDYNHKRNKMDLSGDESEIQDMLNA